MKYALFIIYFVKTTMKNLEIRYDFLQLRTHN